MLNKTLLPDIDALSQYLLSENVDLGSILEIEKFADGQSNPTFKLKTNKGVYVLRSQPAGTLLKSAHAVDREFKVMQALAGSAVPVPRMVHLGEGENPLGRKFFIMEYLDGRIFWDPALSELADGSNEVRREIYTSMNKALAALHNINPSDVGLEEFGRPGNYYQRQLSRWSQQYVSSEVDKHEDIDWLIKWLEENQPEDDGIVSLVHGDYRLDNMIFDKKTSAVLGILDWELSTLGHPIADLAYQCMSWRLPNVGSFRGLAGSNRASLGIPTEEEYVTMYCDRRGIKKIDNWFFYVAFSFFRLAAILQGVYKRSLDGNASDPQRSKTYGAAVPILGQMAVKMIKEES